MVDVLSPAVTAFEQAIRNNSNTVVALQASVTAAEQGLKQTIPMLFRRSQYWTSRSRWYFRLLDVTEFIGGGRRF
jgi:hypothetical protein